MKICRHLGKTLSVLAGTALLLGCVDLFGPDTPKSAVPINPIPAEYAGWWSLIERCSGLSGSLRDVRWLTVPESTVPGSSGAAGRYYSRSNSIVFAEGMELVGALVRHEMLHALLRGGSHPRWAYRERCGGIVSCGGACEAEVGGPIVRDATAPVVDISTLQVGVDVAPNPVRLEGGTEGCVTIVVSARSTSLTSVRVRLTGQPSPIFRQSFGWMLDGYRGGAVAAEDTLMPFNPSETRRHVFECAFVGEIPGWENPPPGVYTVRGYVRAASSEPVPLQIIH